MLPKTKRQRQVESILEKARESKRSRLTDEEPGTSGEETYNGNEAKIKGSGIMVSDFIDEQNGYSQLTEEEYECAKDKKTQQYINTHLSYLSTVKREKATGPPKNS